MPWAKSFIGHPKLKTDKPTEMAKTYSLLHQNIQDKFNEGGVEIMSPGFTAIRDGNQTTIPGSYRPGNYQAPSFRIGEEKKEEGR
ncbi:MAG: hypothetical protein ABII74_02590 [Elusimicrobiota bacterium]